ncbi:DUF1028 domain-containing protein [Alicyclobacillus sp.]|uniref:DUF1028 domain-containing protein n=1 Tax=Alicyclobacillus sp. TaxID=61169 RepID=UPI0025B98595|nr:DUF1028 domain-containing protein [Alicyclobacillus sp.]MCL6517524.1 DUF1028 domain-containing protein [Alicyclobacillus sp.]
MQNPCLLPPVATFSIIGFDPATQTWGIAVQSKFLAVGALVPWAKAGVGAIATQSWANTAYGPQGLALLEEGLHPAEVVERLTQDDEHRDLRQFAVMDRHGNTAAYTGKRCFQWAGHVNGQNFSCQGNILVSEATVTAMAESFQHSAGSLAERLLRALRAAQEAGGDSRGKQSAALYVVREGAGYGGYNDRYIDLRVDDHPDPIAELERLYGLHQLYFGKPDNAIALDLTGDVRAQVREALRALGFLGTGGEDRTLPEALNRFVQMENLEERWRGEEAIDIEVFRYLKDRAERAGR